MSVAPSVYRRGIRPVQPESFPIYTDQELDKLATTITQLIQYAQSLEDRIAALEP